MESTAALIPFDRLFKFSASELNGEYRVNLFKKVKEENAELLGMFGEEELEKKGSESEAEAEDNEDEDKDDEKAVDNEEDNEVIQDDEAKKKSKGKKGNKKVSRKMRELEYDYDDPFIDDSEITDVYQSVFELMRGGGSGPRDGEDESAEEAEEESNKKEKGPVKERNFFVYRGTMTPEILAKEFEIDVEDLLAGEETSEGETEEGEGDTVTIKKEPKKRKANMAIGPVKKAKTVVKPVKEPKQPKLPKEPKKKKPSDLIAQSAKKFNDLFSSEDANEKASATSAAASAVVFNVNGVDANLLELREVLKRFRDSAVGTPFSPGKFPSVLRPRLNESICTVLRVCRPSSTALFPTKLFSALASFLPFSAAALNKLLTRKILRPLMDGIEKTELPKMY